MSSAKQVIFNDPIYGFITIPNELIYRVINHPYFLRLHRIRQLGLTGLVYPGALHTRFQHAIGAMHLADTAIRVLRSKGVKITQREADGTLLAVLLHDIGHGPFSHALEHSIVHGISHETLSEMFLQKLNQEFKGELSEALRIFGNRHPKKFLRQLVSSQLDMDRLDYLNRDSFFTGVSEGVISSDRIIKMLNVRGNELVVEAKGIYSIEKFIIARRLMYWQVYLHKTVLSAEFLLIKILQRAKELALRNKKLFCTPALEKFLYNRFSENDFRKNPALLDTFAQLDDNDVYACVKVWMQSDDFILAKLSTNMVNRNLYKIRMQDTPFVKKEIYALKEKVRKKYGLSKDETGYFVFSDEVSHDAYRPDKIRIKILYKDGRLADIARASDQSYIAALQQTVKKYFLCWTKGV